MKKKKLLKIFANTNIVLGIIALSVAVITVLMVGFPKLFYFLNLNSPETEFATLTKSIGSDFEKYEPNTANVTWRKIDDALPQIDTNLPTGKILNIPKIGINGEIFEGEDYDTLLEQGIWRVNDFGTPEDEIVTILASHRFGYITWSSDYRNSNSFYHLPKTVVGDYIEVVWNQRLYTYEIYKAEESTEINDYTADLILYTCKLYNSPVRIFRYANRIN